MKKKKPEKIKRKNSQLDPLNSELGSFGLEPPKVYRREQQTSDNNHYVIRQNVKSPNSKNKKAKKRKTI